MVQDEAVPLPRANDIYQGIYISQEEKELSFYQEVKEWVNTPFRENVLHVWMNINRQVLIFCSKHSSLLLVQQEGLKQMHVTIKKQQHILYTPKGT